MVLLGIILLVFFLIWLILLGIYWGNIEIEIKKFKADTESKVKDYLIYIKLKLFKRITVVKIKMDDDKVNKFKVNKKIMEKIDSMKSKDTLKLIVKNLDIELKSINLDIKLAMTDAFITSISVGIISSLISTVIAKKFKNYKKEKCNFIVSPIYKEDLQIAIEVRNCIIDVKLVHIINIVYILFKKGSVKKYERASNRRTYVCSND